MSTASEGLDFLIANARNTKEKTAWMNFKSALEIVGPVDLPQQEMTEDIPGTFADEDLRRIREAFSKVLETAFPKVAAALAHPIAFLALLSLESDEIALDPGEALRNPTGRTPEELHRDAALVMQTIPNDAFQNFDPDFIRLVITHWPAP